MQSESIFFSFLSLFVLVSFFITLIIKKISRSFFSESLLDIDFNKPQAFHKDSIPRCGGLSSIILLIIFSIMNFIFFQSILIDYMVIGILLFTVGFLDDIKTNISPILRLVLMIFFLITSIYIFQIEVYDVDWAFLDQLLLNRVFHIIFILLCFLFIINGANLIDGFNGLLGINLLIINFILLSININDGNNQLVLIIITQIIMLFTYLMFNFPRAQIFLGDSGSYFFGSLLVLNIIKTNNSHSGISSFFFCVILFYLFFEVFFSFFRKIYLNKSPLKPDANHLHMLSYRWLEKSQKFKDCNYLNSILINSIYVILILPALFLKDNAVFCKYWFFSLLIIYILFYLRLYSFAKK